MAKYNILLFEPVHPCGQDHLLKNDCEILWANGFEPDQIIASVKDADGILARARGFIDGPVMDRAPRLKVIGRHGIGVDNIDVDAATERGIYVVNTPGAPVEAGRRIYRHVLHCLAAQNWSCRCRDPLWRLGTSRPRTRPRITRQNPGQLSDLVALAVASRKFCSLGFRMNVIYTDEFPAPAEEENRLNVRRVELDDLLSNSDYISLNVPLLDSTHHLINADTLARMQPHAIIANCSRGPVIDEQALVTALRNKQIGGAIIDVFEQEPATPDNPLCELDNVLLSPHYSGHSAESIQKMAMVAADIVRVLNGQKPEFPVNGPL